MLTIYKYPLVIGDEQLVEMPATAEILSAAMQGGRPTLWARVNTDAPPMTRRILLRGTGHPTPSDPFIASVFDGQFVWHLFDGGAA